MLQKIEYMVDNVTSESLLLDWERGYCVQYRETDPTFIELLAAEDGWYYFDHHEDRSKL
ncbi:contractile injection system protein, VgrG/Pvc8 family [Rodentibacter pneumotropicus]|uniref:contractile injection system protein, VgrG/Pvc8 family n=1 Tax=Rodentibacter pneumotropicus TaxID=758 RepID=UPI002418626D|nr:contractile injection system protein, VgrG/Pvc8 family [Rodentibacter pneumotropicus]